VSVIFVDGDNNRIQAKAQVGKSILAAAWANEVPIPGKHRTNFKHVSTHKHQFQATVVEEVLPSKILAKALAATAAMS